jgi:hypothetical protein
MPTFSKYNLSTAINTSFKVTKYYASNGSLLMSIDYRNREGKNREGKFECTANNQAGSGRATNNSASPPPQRDIALEYAKQLTDTFLGGPICDQLKSLIFQFANGNAPENVKIKQMETVFNKAYDHRCVLDQ